MMAQDEVVDPGGPMPDAMDTVSPRAKPTKAAKIEMPSKDDLRLDLGDLDEEDGERREEGDDTARGNGSVSVPGDGSFIDDIESEDLPPPEMTPEEKQAMVDCVRRGDVEDFEDILDNPAADINMIWFSENLLMTAVRWKREEMAYYLIDNGVDILFETSRLQRFEDPNDPKKTVLRWYAVSCRQIAYDNGLQDVVDAIDLESGESIMHKPLERTKNLWKPKEQRELDKLRANNELFSDFSSITAPVDLLWEDPGAMADTEATNSTVNSPRDGPLTPSEKSNSVRSEKELTVDTRVVMEVRPGEAGRRKSLQRTISKELMGEAGDKIGRRLSTDSLRARLPTLKVEGEDEDVMLNTVKEEAVEGIADGIGGQASGENDDLLPCHSRGACTDDGVYGKRSPLSMGTLQSRVKSANAVRIGGTRTDVYRKRDAKRKLMLREQNQNGADFMKPVITNGSYALESKRWSAERSEQKSPTTPRESITPISGVRKVRPPSPKLASQTSDVFIKPQKPARITSSPRQIGNYTRQYDGWESFPSIGTKTTRLQHQQTYLIDVGGRNVRDKK